MTLTPDQIKAVALTEKSAVVVAGAGSGKTRVLTEHFKQLVSAGVPIYRILAFTFTEKAATEIRERLLADEILQPEFVLRPSPQETRPGDFARSILRDRL